MNNPLLYPIESPVSCQGCCNKGFMKYPGICPYGISDCMEKIKVEDILKKIKEITNRENENTIFNHIS